MPKYENRVIVVSGGEEEINRRIDQLVRDGWRVLSLANGHCGQQLTPAAITLLVERPSAVQAAPEKPSPPSAGPRRRGPRERETED